MRILWYVLAALEIVFALPATAQTVVIAPVNLAPNSQWEVMSGWSFIAQENYQGR